MLFAYEDAKSPRSPLGQISLNTKFMVSKNLMIFQVVKSSIKSISIFHEIMDNCENNNVVLNW